MKPFLWFQAWFKAWFRAQPDRSRSFKRRVRRASRRGQRLGDTILATIAFYTCLPVFLWWKPEPRSLHFNGVAAYAPALGLILGLGLALLDTGLAALAWPPMTRSAIIVIVWLAITGGLHLDGAIDTADGLSVLDRSRRLSVMADSTVGAFGAMAAAIILILKIIALADISNLRWLALAGSMFWGRWGQLLAIIAYPYLRATGKGKLHKEGVRSPWAIVPSLVLGLALSAITVIISPSHWPSALGLGFGGCSIALLTGAYFDRQLGGQTGDTYGAIVEWTETLTLCLLSRLLA